MAGYANGVWYLAQENPRIGGQSNRRFSVWPVERSYSSSSPITRRKRMFESSGCDGDAVGDG
jgi:hypothetical protein